MLGDTRLDDTTFMLYAARHYTAAGSVSISEFYEDLGRIKNINRLVRRYTRTGQLSERLILNHLVALYNVFDSPALTRMLVYKLQPFLDILQPFLVYLSRWPDGHLREIGPLGDVIDCGAITGHPDVVAKLKEL